MTVRSEFELKIQTGSANLGDHSQRTSGPGFNKKSFFDGQVGQVGARDVKNRECIGLFLNFMSAIMSANMLTIWPT